MSEEQLALLEWLALSLEASVGMASTRVEHVRVTGHAAVARRLADELRAAAPVIA